MSSLEGNPQLLSLNILKLAPYRHSGNAEFPSDFDWSHADGLQGADVFSLGGLAAWAATELRGIQHPDSTKSGAQRIPADAATADLGLDHQQFSLTLIQSVQHGENLGGRVS